MVENVEFVVIHGMVHVTTRLVENMRLVKLSENIHPVKTLVLRFR
jgi:hypothetical protein